MKRILMLMLVIVLLSCGLCGCAGEAVPSPSAEAETSSPEAVPTPTPDPEAEAAAYSETAKKYFDYLGKTESETLAALGIKEGEGQDEFARTVEAEAYVVYDSNAAVTELIGLPMKVQLRFIEFEGQDELNAVNLIYETDGKATDADVETLKRLEEKLIEIYTHVYMRGPISGLTSAEDLMKHDNGFLSPTVLMISNSENPQALKDFDVFLYLTTEAAYENTDKPVFRMVANYKLLIHH